MSPAALVNGLKTYLETLVSGHKYESWLYIGKTNKAYGSPGGGWKGQNGYEFEKDKSNFILRSIKTTDKRYYFVIESNTLPGQLFNIRLDDSRTHRQSAGHSVLIESYAMTVGTGPKKRLDVKLVFDKLGFKTNEITKIDDASPKWNIIVRDLLTWGIARESVKKSIISDSSLRNESASAENVDHQLKKASSPLNLIFFGPPGTGKTYNTVNKALEIIGESIEGKPRKEIKELFDTKMQEGQIIFTTFHQSMSYEDFVEGIKPQEPKVEGHQISYKVEDGIFKKLCQKANSSFGNIDNVLEDFKNEISEVDGKKPITIKAKGTSFDVVYRGTNVFYIQPHASIKDKPWYPVNIDNILKVFKTGDFTGVYNPTYVREIVNFLEKNRGLKKGQNENNIDKPFVLIIDEINRGNISQIFGELITLIEEDKRLGNDEALEALLPYSKEKFGVPANLYIIGTMNTADRSVEAIDTALRRRFCFEEMSPLYDLDELDYDIAGHNVGKILFVINKRIEKLLDKDHAIGHSYFIRKNDETPEEKFLNSFYHNIIPLLQEYFFGDFGKIGLVLGQGFVQMKEWNKNSDSFADFEYESASEFEDRSVYEVIDYRKETDGTAEFLKAIRRLMNEKVE